MQTQAKELPGNLGQSVLIRTYDHTQKLEPKWSKGFYITAKRYNSYRISNGKDEKIIHSSNVKLVEDDEISK